MGWGVVMVARPRCTFDIWGVLLLLLDPPRFCQRWVVNPFGVLCNRGTGPRIDCSGNSRVAAERKVRAMLFWPSDAGGFLEFCEVGWVVE